MRLNKFISHHTTYSRREADKLIFDGKVKINGKIVTNPAYEVQNGDKVAVNGKPVKKVQNIRVLFITSQEVNL